MDLEEAQALIDRGPYLSWLGLKVLSIAPDAVSLQATWREDWVANPGIGQTQGGILAALIDFTADFALIDSLGRLVPTINMQVDYHRMAKRGDLFTEGRVIKAGRQFSVCEAQVFDAEGTLLASGRATFATAPVPAAK